MRLIASMWRECEINYRSYRGFSFVRLLYEAKRAQNRNECYSRKNEFYFGKYKDGWFSVMGNRIINKKRLSDRLVGKLIFVVSEDVRLATLRLERLLFSEWMAETLSKIVIHLLNFLIQSSSMIVQV